jgi:hypothetical protein
LELKNERIKELAKNATIQEGSHGAFGEPTVNEYVDLEKFAELIVSECAGIYEAIDNGNKIESTDNYIKALRKRFGV